jgi:hypothetical protein
MENKNIRNFPSIIRVNRNNWSRIRVCLVCNKSELVRKDNISKQCVTCSRKESAKKSALIKKEKAISSEHNYCACSNCNEKFYRVPSAQTKNNFCSKSCQKNYSRVDWQCKYCKCQFSVSKGVMSGKTNASANFCSRPCYEKWLCRTDRVTGRGSRWVKHRLEALKKTPFCGRCGTLKNLQVHHIIPFRITFDNSQSNLIPLCVKCHKTVECVTNEIESVETDIERMKVVLGIMLFSQRNLIALKIKQLMAA